MLFRSVSANITGTQNTGFTLHLTISGGFKGTFRVFLQLTDSMDIASQSFFVHVQ